MNKSPIAYLGVVLLAFMLSSCGKKDACLDRGGCWDSTDNVCRKDEPNAQELCERGSQKFTVDPYLEDFEALKEHLSKAYANLEPISTHYKIDLYDLNRETVELIKKAKNDETAKEIFKNFAKSFKDGHFSIREQKKTQNNGIEKDSSNISIKSDGQNACKAMGFSWDKDFKFKFPIVAKKIIKQDAGEFPYLVVEHQNKKIGILRVSDFRPSVYPKICMESWEKYKKTLKTNCDEDCQDTFQYEFLRKDIVNKFYQSLSAIRKVGVSALVIDVTHNGGGSDWVEDITALLTTKKLVCGKSGFVKHPHHANNFKKLLKDLESDRPRNEAKIVNMKKNVKTASEVCDRSKLWTTKGHKNNCSLIGYRVGEMCKYPDLKYPGKEKYSGKLFILINRHTASAAEDIAARHLDSGTATVIGSKTYGAGCGYMNGGIKFSLPNSQLEVRVPDCVRESAAGVNEVLGIEPTIKLDMEKLKTNSFLNDLLDKLVGDL